MPTKNIEQSAAPNIDRRKNCEHFLITDQQLETLADEAAQRAIDKIYAEIGSNVAKKLSLAIGAALATIYAWLTGLVQFGPKH